MALKLETTNDKNKVCISCIQQAYKICIQKKHYEYHGLNFHEHEIYFISYFHFQTLLLFKKTTKTLYGGEFRHTVFTHRLGAYTQETGKFLLA